MAMKIILAAAALCLLQNNPAWAETQAAAVVDDGYAGKALQKIMGAFSSSVQSGQRIEAKLSLDAEGRLVECRALKGDAKSLCQAAKSASPYGNPPYGVATDILVAIWAGKQPASTKTSQMAKAENPSAAATAGHPGAVDTKYLNKIRKDLRNAMYIPEKTKPGTYYATVRLTCDSAGKILNSAIIKTSGDSQLDKYVLQGIHRAGSVSPPPKGTPESFDITFTLVRR